MSVLSRFKAWRLELERRETLSAVRNERSAFEDMLRRAECCGESPSQSWIPTTSQDFARLESEAGEAPTKEELERLNGAAESLSRKRAYICPRGEIRTEGELLLDLMMEWGVPRRQIDGLRRLSLPEEDPAQARSALRALYAEFDSWSTYLTDYHDVMLRYTWWMLGLIVGLELFAIASVTWWPQQMALFAILLSGGAGACASVVSKLPAAELRLSHETDSYLHRMLSRVGTGLLLSMIGSALLGWGVPVPVNGHTFATLLAACGSPESCTRFDRLFLLAVPAAFGFTERLVAHFNGPWFGQLRSSRRPS